MAFQRLDVAVQVTRADARFHKEVGKVLRHLLGERRDQHAVAVLDDFFDAVEQYVHLALDGEHLDFRVQKSGRSVNLFGNDAARLGEFVIAGGGTHEEHLLRVHVLEFGKVHRAVVQRTRKAEAVLHKRRLAGFVALSHAAHLRNAHVGFVHHQEPVVAEVIDKRKRARTRCAVLDNAGVVLDAAAHAGLANHFHVVSSAARKAGRFQHLAFLVEFRKALGQFHLHALQNSCAAFFLGHEVLCRSDGHLVHFLSDFAGNDVEANEPVHLVAEKFDSQAFLVVARVDFNHVAVHAEAAAFQAEIVSRVLNSHQVMQNLVAVVNVTLFDAHHQVEIFARATQTVDAAYGGNDNHIPAGEQVRGRAQAELVNLVVDARVLLDEGVCVRNIRFGLEIVVIAYEVFHRIVREKRLEFLVELRRERLVVRQNQRRLAYVLDDVRHRESLAGTCDAKQRLELLPVLETFGEFLYGLRLVARRSVRAHEFEVRARRRLELFEVPR